MKPEELEQYYLEMTAELMTDHEPLMAELMTVKWWMLLTAVQYTWRDENLSKPMRDMFKLIGGQLGDMLLYNHPDAKKLIEAGWDTSLDRRPSSAEQRDDAIDFLRGMYGLDDDGEDMD